MRSQRVDKKTGSEGIVPKLSFKYVSLEPEADQNAAAGLPETDHNADAGAPESADLPEADQNAAAGLPETDHNADAGAPESDHADAGVPEADQNATAGAPEADHNAAASAPEADAGPEAEGGLREKLAAMYSPYNTIMVVLLVVLHVPAFYFMFAKAASEAERLSNAEWEFGFFAGMDVLFVLNLNLKAHPNGRWYNTSMITLMLVCNIVLVCFGAMRASNDPSESQALKVVFAVVEVCAVLVQDGLYVRHLHITLDVASRHETN